MLGLGNQQLLVSRRETLWRGSQIVIFSTSAKQEAYSYNTAFRMLQNVSHLHCNCFLCLTCDITRLADKVNRIG